MGGIAIAALLITSRYSPVDHWPMYPWAKTNTNQTKKHAINYVQMPVASGHLDLIEALPYLHCSVV
jgi:hypothetical protein